jgi:hypothetical protein
MRLAAVQPRCATPLSARQNYFPGLPVWFHDPLDTLNREVGGICRPLVAERGDIPSSLFAAIGRRAHRVKALLLLVGK